MDKDLGLAMTWHDLKSQSAPRAFRIPGRAPLHGGVLIWPRRRHAVIEAIAGDVLFVRVARKAKPLELEDSPAGPAPK